MRQQDGLGDAAGESPAVVLAAPTAPSQRHEEEALERALDATLAASFPASDPPSWTTGTATLAAAPSHS